jgi:mannose-6-phosphate isomerase-like protein (cupin superfamily)
MAKTFPYVINIEKATLENKAFRQVLHTNSRQQLVLMSLIPGEEIGMEVHENVDQFIRIEKGIALAVIIKAESRGKKTKYYLLEDGDCIMIPLGFYHNIINVGDEDLKLYTIYSPPEHKPGTYQEFHP